MQGRFGRKGPHNLQRLVVFHGLFEACFVRKLLNMYVCIFIIVIHQIMATKNIYIYCCNILYEVL